MTHSHEGPWRTRAVWLLAVVILVAGGIAYRALAPRWRGKGQGTIKLPVPLAEIPLTVGDWVGTETEIQATTQEYMRKNFADDYTSRHYVNATAGVRADLYVVYCASRPAGILGHRPGVCYPAHGWIPDSVEKTEFESALGSKVPCLIQRFHKPVPNYQEVVTLSLYVVNGQMVTDERSFSGMMGRSPNISGDPARYVAQIQISASYENSVRRAAADMVDMVLEYLPDKDGVVEAVGVR